MTFEDDRAIAINFLAGTSSVIGPAALALLAASQEWIEPASLLEQLASEHDNTQLALELVAMLDAGVVIVDHTEAAELDARFEQHWAWGPTGGLFHFGIKDPNYGDPEALRAWMTERVATATRVPLWTEPGPDGIALPPPSADDPLLATMRSRRSYRGFDGARAIAIEALRDCLVAGFGIVGFAETAIVGEGPLPFGMTPSGGARNPYEAYVLAARVSGLEPGVYRYAGIDNSLARVSVGELPSFASLLGNQSWFEDAAALLLLVANFPRSMWKYQHPGGLRVVLIEAGHIAQNMLLCATARGLAAAPTCAISDRNVERACGLDRVTQAALYVVGLGERGEQPSIADVPELAPNPRLVWTRA